MPLNYDEWWSYRFFSGQSYWATLSWYPMPNNHVLYNLASGFFNRFPFDAEVAVRLPSLIASVITTYYFFKLCKHCFNNTLSLILLVFVITSYPMIIYSFQARGYSFVNLFCILLMYASAKLFENYKSKKYRTVFILSVFGGMMSIPSFVYVILPVIVVLSVYLLKQKRSAEFLLFVKDGLISVLLAVLGYSFILGFNSSGNLLNPNGGSTKFSLTDTGAFDQIANHLKAIGSFLLFNENYIFTLSVLILVSAVIYIYRARGISRYSGVLSLAMFFSPLFILILHRVIPFQRTWLYLIFPVTLCFGFIIKNAQDLFQQKFRFHLQTGGQVFVHSLTILCCVSILCLFSDKYYRANMLDFEMQALREQHLNKVIRKVKKITYTKADYEFYVADITYAVCYKDKKRWVDIDPLDTIKNQDILVIERSKLSQFANSLGNYKLLRVLNNRIVVFGKDSLFR